MTVGTILLLADITGDSVFFPLNQDFLVLIELSKLNYLHCIEIFGTVNYVQMCYVRRMCRYRPMLSNTDHQATNTTVKIDCTAVGHMTRNSKYINPSTEV